MVETMKAGCENS